MSMVISVIVAGRSSKMYCCYIPWNSLVYFHLSPHFSKTHFLIRLSFIITELEAHQHQLVDEMHEDFHMICDNFNEISHDMNSQLAQLHHQYQIRQQQRQGMYNDDNNNSTSQKFNQHFPCHIRIYHPSPRHHHRDHFAPMITTNSNISMLSKRARSHQGSIGASTTSGDRGHGRGWRHGWKGSTAERRGALQCSHLLDARVTPSTARSTLSPLSKSVFSARKRSAFCLVMKFDIKHHRFLRFYTGNYRKWKMWEHFFYLFSIDNALDGWWARCEER